MVITVFSGKGGTGKTTVSANLFNSIENEYPVQLVDVDVEEPNTSLFFDVNFTKEESVDILIPKINDNRCTRCGICAQECQFGAIAIGAKSSIVFPNMCHGCGLCKMVCPEEAITEIPRSIGIIKQGNIKREDDYIMGIMNTGELSGTRIIREVKKKINKRITAIIDAPPGTSCPVLESLEGVDFALLVTEPTPFGLHDLKLAIETVKSLSIPSGIIINKDNNSFKGIDELSKEENIPILLRIPFSKEFAMLYSKGLLLTKDNDKLKKSFKQLYQTVGELAR